MSCCPSDSRLPLPLMKWRRQFYHRRTCEHTITMPPTMFHITNTIGFLEVPFLGPSRCQEDSPIRAESLYVQTSSATWQLHHRSLCQGEIECAVTLLKGSHFHRVLRHISASSATLNCILIFGVRFLLGRDGISLLLKKKKKTQHLTWLLLLPAEILQFMKVQHSSHKFLKLRRRKRKWRRIKEWLGGNAPSFHFLSIAGRGCLQNKEVQKLR